MGKTEKNSGLEGLFESVGVVVCDKNCNGDCKSSSSVGGLVCVKRKVYTKHLPPDVSAIKLLAELENGEASEDEEQRILNMSDEELKEFKKSIIKEMI